MEELAPYMRGWRSYFGFCETPEVLLYLTRWVIEAQSCSVAAVENTASSPGGTDRLGVLPRLASNTAGSGRGPWYLARSKALSVGALECVLQIARTSVIGRGGLA